MRTVGGAAEKNKKNKIKSFSIQVTSEGMSSLAQQMEYRLRSCLSENKHCFHICKPYNRPEV